MQWGPEIAMFRASYIYTSVSPNRRERGRQERGTNHRQRLNCTNERVVGQVPCIAEGVFLPGLGEHVRSAHECLPIEHIVTLEYQMQRGTYDVRESDVTRLSKLYHVGAYTANTNSPCIAVSDCGPSTWSIASPRKGMPGSRLPC